MAWIETGCFEKEYIRSMLCHGRRIGSTKSQAITGRYLLHTLRPLIGYGCTGTFCASRDTARPSATLDASTSKQPLLLKAVFQFLERQNHSYLQRFSQTYRTRIMR